ncbi:MAG: PAS domain S-box protein [Nitrospirales bacterium]|nr:PAS domain S-box protein [Nitrospirales bacterium]
MKKERSRENLTEDPNLLQKQRCELRKAATKKREEERLCKNDDMFRYVFEHCPSGQSITSPAGEIQVNKAFCTMLGYTQEELQNHRWQDITHPDDIELTLKAINPLFSGEQESARFIKRYLHKNGDVVWADVCTTLRMDEAGKPLHFITSVNDITDLRRTEEELRQANERFRIIVESNIIGIVIADPAGKIIEANDYYLNLIGFTRDELERGRVDWKAITPPEWLPADEQAIRELKERGTCTPYEKEYILRDGKRVSVYLLDAMLPGPEEQIAAFVLDITERKRAEEALRRSEQLNRSLVEHLPLNVFLKDRQSAYLLCNANYAYDLGIEPAEIVGKKDFDFYPSELAEKYRTDDQEVMTSGKKKEIDERYTVHGKKRWAHTIKAPYYDELGHVVGVIGLFEDITEMKSLIDALARSNRDLKQFAHVTSHELQEPLRSIVSFTELLAEKYRSRLDDKADRYIDFIVSGTRRMSKRINDLLVYSTITHLANNHVPTDCSTVIKRVLSDRSLRIEESKAVVTFDSLPTVTANDTQLGLLFQNLISNSIKFRGKDPLRIHISALSVHDFLRRKSDLSPDVLKHLQEIEKGWVFSVVDNGIGIESPYYDQIFQIFQRLHTEEEYPGTGIGLAVCKKVIEMHGGRIWVESEMGKGSTFYFTVPES